MNFDCSSEFPAPLIYAEVYTQISQGNLWGDVGRAHAFEETLGEPVTQSCKMGADWEVWCCNHPLPPSHDESRLGLPRPQTSGLVASTGRHGWVVYNFQSTVSALWNHSFLLPLAQLPHPWRSIFFENTGMPSPCVCVYLLLKINLLVPLAQFFLSESF